VIPAVSISTATLAFAIAMVLMRMRPGAKRLQSVATFITGTALAVVLSGFADHWLTLAANWTAHTLSKMFSASPDAAQVIRGVCAALPWVLPAVLILVFLLQIDPRRGGGKGFSSSANTTHVGGKGSGGGLKRSTPWLALLVPMAFVMVPWSQLGIGG
jgi:preprotein translocase subunit SecG